MDGRLFQSLLVGATVTPFFMYLLPESTAVAATILLITTFGGFHVYSTWYLFFSKDIVSGVPNWKFTILTMPIVLVASVYIVIFLMPMWMVMAVFVVVIHFAIWHFGRQNLGVLTFSLRIGCGRSIDPFERYTVIAGIVAGMCAAYTYFGPSLLLPDFVAVPVSPLAPVLRGLWYVGAAIYAALIPVVAYHVWRRRSNYDIPSLVLYISSIFFFAALFLTSNPMYSGNWQIAHGAQYELFIVYHLKSRLRATLAGLVPVGVLLVVATAGTLLWRTYPHWSPSWLAHVGAAAVIALTIAHYWVDMFLWRFQTPERRAWLLRHYRFIAGPAPSGRLVPAAGD